MKTPWQVRIAQARMAGPVFEQRAYKAPCGCVHFYPSHCWRICHANGDDPHWYDDKPKMPGECASMFTWEHDFAGAERLTDAEARAIWATRPEGMK